MARKCKCCITGESGTIDTFVKISNKYYKSQETYDEYQHNANLRKEIVRFICEDLLGYKKGMVFPSLLTRKLKEFDFYDNEVILKTFQLKAKDIGYWVNVDGKFKDDNGKISYMFAIIKSEINEVYKSWKREKQINQKQNKEVEDIDIPTENINTRQ